MSGSPDGSAQMPKLVNRKDTPEALVQLGFTQSKSGKIVILGVMRPEASSPAAYAYLRSPAAGMMTRKGVTAGPIQHCARAIQVIGEFCAYISISGGYNGPNLVQAAILPSFMFARIAMNLGTIYFRCLTLLLGAILLAPSDTGVTDTQPTRTADTNPKTPSDPGKALGKT